MIEKKIYLLKEEFWVALNIPKSQWERRKDDLLQWWLNFFDYEILDGRPLRIEIKEVYGEYQPLPRKISITNMEEKMGDYERFAIASLGTEFKPNSKSKVAREAIASFGFEKYQHTSHEAVAKRFIKPAFDKYGECDNHYQWVWYNSYIPMTEEEVEAFRQILRNEQVSEQEVLNAFYCSESDDAILEKKQCFRKAIQKAKEQFGDFGIRVPNWRLRPGD